MPTLKDLPPELLGEVFHYLDSIDDVHHLGRTCKATYHVIRRQTVYTEIMRSVIGRSPQHRFDISLCRMLDLHRDVVQHFANGGGSIPPTQLSHYPNGALVFHPVEAQLVSAVTNECRHAGRPCIQCLPDERIYEILARYQGLRILEDQWLARPLDDNDLLPVDYSMDGFQLIGRYNSILARDHEFQNTKGLGSSRECDTSFNPDQRGRFHAALISVWLYNEIRWILTQFTHPAPSFALQLRLLEACKTWIKKQHGTKLVDDLDRYAMFQFMYHHLLPLHASFLADRDSSKLPLTFPSNLERSSVYCIRFLQLFLVAGQTYLQPPDLINLMIRSRLTRKSPYPLLTTPDFTDKWCLPSAAHSFPSNVDYSKKFPNPFSSGRTMRISIAHLNLIARSTINQCESHPQRQVVQNPNPSALFSIVKDDTAAYLKEMALTRFDMYARQSGDGRRYLDIRKVFRKEWPETWWNIWWWANSEEKARAKMERWRVREIL